MVMMEFDYWTSSSYTISLPFCTVGAIADRSGLFHSEGETVLTWSELNCTGTEMAVKDCLALASKDCLSDEAASVICQGMRPVT